MSLAVGEAVALGACLVGSDRDARDLRPPEPIWAVIAACVAAIEARPVTTLYASRRLVGLGGERPREMWFERKGMCYTVQYIGGYVLREGGCASLFEWRAAKVLRHSSDGYGPAT
jgi:hypothetical protein